MEMSARQRGRAVADHSAEFYVEDVPAPRYSRDKDASSQRLPRLQKPPPKSRDTSQSSGGGGNGGSATGALPKQPITGLDPHRLAQRQKQVDYGKNTIGYQRYTQQVPKDMRRRKGEQWLDPVTPDIHQNISKRCFDGQIKVWRRALHKYDDQGEEDEQAVRPLSFAERNRRPQRDFFSEDVTAVSAVPSSPTNSSRSRGSLDGYLEPHFADGGRKRCFQRAFDHAANGNPHPSKLITSPAGPKPFVPQSAPPATAADADTAPSPSPALRFAAAAELTARAGARAGLPRGAAGGTGSRAGELSAGGAPKAPSTAPPAAVAPRRVTAGSTADSPDRYHRTRSHGAAARSELELGTAAAAAAGDDLFREWEDEEYAGLEPLADEELEQVWL